MKDPFELDIPASAPRTAKEIRADLAFLTKKDRPLEDLLTARAWFPYRLMDHVDRTIEFVRAYDRVYYSLKLKNADLDKKMRIVMERRRSYLRQNEVLAPYLDPTSAVPQPNPRWKQWVKARRSADKRGMIYDDYVAGALLAGMKRGWTKWPSPNQLASKKLLGLEDEFHDATIPAYEARKYAADMKIVRDIPFFTAAAWSEHPVQVAYVEHLRAEIGRLHPGVMGLPNQRAGRIWRDMIHQGLVHASLLLAPAI